VGLGLGLGTGGHVADPVAVDTAVDEGGGLVAVDVSSDVAVKLGAMVWLALAEVGLAPGVRLWT